MALKRLAPGASESHSSQQLSRTYLLSSPDSNTTSRSTLDPYYLYDHPNRISSLLASKQSAAVAKQGGAVMRATRTLILCLRNSQ